MKAVNYDAFLTQVIDAGVKAAEADYAGDDGNKAQQRKGSIQGFEECRLKTPAELALLLQDATDDSERAFGERAGDYWYWRCRTLEIEWVCNCVSAVLYNERRPTIIPPTARGMMRAAEIVGVAEDL